MEKLGKETINLYNTSENRGREKTSGLSYQTLGCETHTVDLQNALVTSFHSKKYDITQHPDYKYLSDYSKRNAFNIRKFLDTQAKLKSRETCEVYEMEEEHIPKTNV